MRWIAVVLFLLALFAASCAAVAAESDAFGPPLDSYGKGWCRSC